MKKAKFLRAICLISLLLVTGINAWAAPSNFGPPAELENPNVEDYVWQEGETTLPDYPLDENLIEFESEAVNSRFRYFIDKKSISIGEADGVVRYTLVIRSDRGSTNVSYEGMRCQSVEYKVYAYGIKGKFRILKRPKWRPIDYRANYSYRKVLFGDAMCSADVLIEYSPERIIRALQYGPDDRVDAPFR